MLTEIIGKNLTEHLILSFHFFAGGVLKHTPLTLSGSGGSSGPGSRGAPILTPLGSKLNAYTFWLFLTIPIDHYRTIKQMGKQNYLRGQKKSDLGRVKWSKNWKLQEFYQHSPAGPYQVSIQEVQHLARNELVEVQDDFLTPKVCTWEQHLLLYHHSEIVLSEEEKMNLKPTLINH